MQGALVPPGSRSPARQAEPDPRLYHFRGMVPFQRLQQDAHFTNHPLGAITCLVSCACCRSSSSWSPVAALDPSRVRWPDQVDSWWRDEHTDEGAADKANS